MTNHIHLQLETKDVEIWHIMRNINLLYTKYFNNKYNFVGHLFQGRYKSEIIENDTYNLETSRYIHLNPVKANMVDTPIEYKWSSYDIYMGQRKSEIVSEEKILSYFKNNSRKLYREYAESKLIDENINLELSPNYSIDFSDVKGQDVLIEYIVVAAAGGHNMLMVGSPGCGNNAMPGDFINLTENKKSRTTSELRERVERAR